MPCVVKVALSSLGCSTAIIHMVVKENSLPHNIPKVVH